MRRSLVIAMAATLSACSPAETPQAPIRQAAEPSTPLDRARLQLEHRLDGPVTFENIRHGLADSGRPMVCGVAIVKGVRKAFVMGDFLILEDDASPAQMAALNRGCTVPD
jgi:hypothetical protein